MSFQASTWVINNSQHKGSALLVMLMIANHAHADGTNAFPSLETLARECRMSVRQITRIVAQLEDSGELRVERSSGRLSHRYSLPFVQPEAPPNPDKMSTLNPDKMSTFKKPTLTFEAPNPDILSSNPDIAMSTEPSEPKEELKTSAAAAPPAGDRELELRRLHREGMSYLQTVTGPIPDGQAQGAALKWLLNNYTLEICKACLDELLSQGWRKSRVSWQTVKNEIGTMQAREASNGKSDAGVEAGAGRDTPKAGGGGATRRRRIYDKLRSQDPERIIGPGRATRAG